MRLIVVRAGLSVALLGGCAGPVHRAPLGSDHPASLSAAEAPVPEPSTTLALDPSAIPSAEVRGVVPPQVHHAGDHAAPAAGHDHAAMQGMSHDDTGHTPRGSGGVPATSPATNALYACPMHPDVTSKNPNDRCPKCGMKINKPVKATTSPALNPAAPSAQHQLDHSGENK